MNDDHSESDDTADTARDAEALRISNEVRASLEKGAGPRTARILLAFLSGIPGVGGAAAAAAATAAGWSERDQSYLNDLYESWLRIQQKDIRDIAVTLAEVLIRLDLEDKRVRERLESEEYLSFVRRCFREWATAETAEKRRLVRNLLTRAAEARVVSDEVVRLFIDWIARYSDLHFKVVREVFNSAGVSARALGTAMFETLLTDSSAEADLYKVIIHELTTGYVIRQPRQVGAGGQFMRKGRAKKASSAFLKSPFDGTTQYVLTDMGKQFVHYCMDEIVPKLGSS